MKELAVLNKYFFRYRWRLTAGVVFVILYNYFSVLQPKMVRYALEQSDNDPTTAANSLGISLSQLKKFNPDS